VTVTVPEASPGARDDSPGDTSATTVARQRRRRIRGSGWEALILPQDAAFDHDYARRKRLTNLTNRSQ
jgi:hypothetical protein